MDAYVCLNMADPMTLSWAVHGCFNRQCSAWRMRQGVPETSPEVLREEADERTEVRIGGGLGFVFADQRRHHATCSMND